MSDRILRSVVGAAINGACAGLGAAILGFALTDWQWWLVLALAIIARINGQVAA